MVGRAGNLNDMFSFSDQEGETDLQGTQGAGAPPPPSSDSSEEFAPDPLGIFSAVDSDADAGISESEYDNLTQGILEVTGNEVESSFLDFDTDGDNLLSSSELVSVFDEAGFAPPPPPKGGMEAEGGDLGEHQAGGADMMVQLLGYLQPEAGDLDIIV